MAQAMNPFRTGKLVLFQVTYDRDWHFFEIIFFVILGIFGVRVLSRVFNAWAKQPH
jgi:H+/Cl- antiporter ClcA